jgi:hypothetical protein
MCLFLLYFMGERYRRYRRYRGIYEIASEMPGTNVKARGGQPDLH